MRIGTQPVVDPSASKPVEALGETTGVRKRASWRELGGVTAVATVLVGALIRPLPLDRPILYGSDTFLHMLLGQATDWIGSLGSTVRLGAPHGFDWSVYPTGERLHLVVLHAFDQITGSPVAAVNLHAWLMIVTTVVVAHAVLRWLGLSPLVAAAAALLFAVSPSALQRLAPGHLFLFALFPVALGIYLVVWSIERPTPAGRASTWRRPDRTIARAWAFPLTAATSIALSSVYYAIFTMLLLIGVGAMAAVHRSDARRLLVPLVLSAAVMGVSGMSLAPDLIERRDDPAAGAVERGTSQSESYGLRPAQMLLPRPDHPIEPLAALGERAHSTTSPGDGGAVIGILGVTGLIAMAIAVLRSRPERGVGSNGDPTERSVRVLAATSGVALVLATAGGGGFVLAVLGLTQVRVWSRLAAFVAFCALAGLALLAQRRFGGASRFPHVVGLIALLALVDQGGWTPPRAENERRYEEDLALVRDLEKVGSETVLVAQLPVLPYQDQIGHNRMLAPAVLGDERLRFTGGGYAGGGSDWVRSWFDDEPEVTARAAAAVGSDVLLVARDRMVGEVAALESRLSAVTGSEPRRSRGDAWSWFDLRPLRRQLVREHGEEAVGQLGAAVLRPIGVTYEQVRGVDVEGNDLIQSFGPAGTVVLHGDGSDGALIVRIRLHAEPDATVVLDTGETTKRAQTGRDGEAVLEFELNRSSGSGEEIRIRVLSDGAPISVWQGRDVHLQITDVDVRDAVAARSPVLLADREEQR